MLQTGIFTFCLFSDDYHIYIAMPNKHKKRNKIYKRPQEINYNIIKTIVTRNMFLTGFGEGSYLSDK